MRTNSISVIHYPPVSRYSLLSKTIFISLLLGYAGKLTAQSFSTWKITAIALLFVFLLAYTVVRQAYQSYVWWLLVPIILCTELNAHIQVPLWIHLSEAGCKLLAAPVLFLAVQRNRTITIWMKLAICLTFIAHGLLALGILETPASFYGMVTNILGLNMQDAQLFLMLAGIGDIIACIVLITGRNKFQQYALLYCFCWGLLTALARTMNVFHADTVTLLLNGLAETLVRVPNALIPLLYLLYLKRTRYAI